MNEKVELSEGMELSGLEAHWLLFALDHYCVTDIFGKITIAPCATFKELQSLRDRLFAAHRHPPEDYED